VPSWGYMVEMGATTLWERWDALVKGRPRDASEWSLNHPAFGSVGEWVWRELAGINPDDEQPGYRRIIIRPRPCSDLTWVKAEYDSIRGKIVSNWKKEDGKWVLDVTIPANTTALVRLPTTAKTPDSAYVSKITESGKPLRDAPGVRVLPPKDSCVPVEVVAGQYHFEIPWK
jgi:alpha-L-rhamnosidase